MAAIANRYAKALHSLSVEAGQEDQMSEQLTALGDAWRDARDLRDVFSDPQHTAEARRAVLKGLSDKVAAAPNLKNLLSLLCDRGRMALLPDIATSFSKLVDQQRGLVRAEVISAGPLPAGYLESIKDALQTVTEKRISLVTREDPSIIGGIIARVGDKVFDGSLRNQLNTLRRAAVE